MFLKLRNLVKKVSDSKSDYFTLQKKKVVFKCGLEIMLLKISPLTRQ